MNPFVVEVMQGGNAIAWIDCPNRGVAVTQQRRLQREYPANVVRIRLIEEAE